MQHVSCLLEVSGLGKMIRHREDDIGDLIRAARNRAGMTQRQLADALGLSHSAVGQWERLPPKRRRPGLDHLEAACEVFGITLREFFLGSAEDSAPMTDLEREVLKLFRGLTRDEQRAYLTVLRSSSR